jgi:hypothetical protein
MHGVSPGSVSRFAVIGLRSSVLSRPADDGHVTCARTSRTNSPRFGAAPFTRQRPAEPFDVMADTPQTVSRDEADEAIGRLPDDTWLHANRALLLGFA